MARRSIEISSLLLRLMSGVGVMLIAGAVPIAAGEAKPAAADPAGEVRFHRIDLTAQDAGGAGARGTPGRIFQWLPCGEGVDLLAEHKALYLMKREGVPTRVFSTDEQVFNFRNACYDGRYVWAPAMRPEPLVLVVDPVTERVWRITRDDGLPPTNGGAAAAPLAPGRVCLSGGSDGRGWIARATFDADREATGRPKVDVFFHARDAARDGGAPDHNGWKNPRAPFFPSWMCALRERAAAGPVGQGPAGDKPPRTRVLLGRDGVYYPLLIDPDAGTVDVVHDPFGSTTGGQDLTPEDGSLYWAHKVVNGEPGPHVWRFGFPELKRTVVKEELPEINGTVVFEGGRIHLVGSAWWVAKSPDRPFVSLRGQVPGTWWLRKIVHSQIYGLVVLSWADGDGGAYAVGFKYAD